MMDQQELFTVNTESSGFDSDMLKAAKAHIRLLDDKNILRDIDQLNAQMLISIAEVSGKAAAKGQASAMSFAIKELREVMDKLPTVEDGDKLDEFATKLDSAPVGYGDDVFSE